MSAPYKRERANKSRIQPFWNRIPNFFLYALSPAPLILCIVLAGLSALFPSIPVLILIFSLTIKYAFEVLIRTSEGDMTPPGFTGDVLNQNYGLVFKQIGILLLFIAMITTLYGKGMAMPATVVGVSFLFFLPAMVMVLASSNSLLAAINPVLLIGMVSRVGWSYLGLYGLLFMVYTAESNMHGYLLPRVGPDMILPIYTAVNLYFSVLAYHMMGYLLYQHHEALGIDQRVSGDEDQDPTEAKLDLFHSYMDQGLVDAAKAELFGLAKDDPADSTMQQKLCNFMMMHGTDEEKVKYVRYIVPILLETDRANLAASLYMDLAAGNAKFQLKQADHYLGLIRALLVVSREKEALALAQNIHKRFPKAAEVVDIYIEAAEVLSRSFNRDDLALKMLVFVVKAFPKHPRHNEALRLAKMIHQVSSA